MKYRYIICLILLSFLAEPLFADVLLVQLSQDNNTLVADNIRRGEGTVKPANRHGGSDYRYRCLSADGLVLEEGSFDFPAAPLPLNPTEPFRQTILLQIPWQDGFETFECFPANIPFTQAGLQQSQEEPLSFSIAQELANSRRHIHLENTQPQPVKLIDNGPDENRLTLVFVGDGYTASEQEQYRQDVENSINQILLFEPWSDYADLINVYYIDNTISNESGIGIDSPRDTIFRLYYYYGLSYRLIWSPESTGLITDFLSQYAPAAFDFAFVIANDASGTGGSGGLYPIFNLHAYSIEIAVHEFGHSFAYLADEYVQESIADRYTYSESFPNVMEHLSRDLSVISYDDIPWGVWIEPGIVFPGGGNNGIGLFEGAFYHSQGYYRPQFNCLMRGYGVGFCEVCCEAHVVRLYDFVSPIDSVTPGRPSIIFADYTPRDFSVDLSQKNNPNIQVRWFMDGQLIGQSTQITIDPSIYSSTTADLLVEVSDTSDWIRHDPFIDGSYNPNTNRGIHNASENKVTDSFVWHIQFDIPDIQTAKIIYVDDDAAGANDGSSWQNAYIYLQDALADANDSDKPVEIRIAQGIYKPDQGANQTPGYKLASFRLINGVTLAGGFAGAADPNARDIGFYESILSGDLNGDDVEVSVEDLGDEPTRTENSYHVLIGSGTDTTAVLDGFIITGGNANGEDWPNYFGGGMLNTMSSSKLTNCIFNCNSADDDGGGMFNDNSYPSLINCIFTSNSAGDSGGGIRNKAWSSATFTNCIFSSNTAGNSGGGMDNSSTDIENSGSNVQLNNCLFEENRAIYGGGISCHGSDPNIVNCTFSRNSAQYEGGGMYNNESSSTLTNCTFSMNRADTDGGAIYNSTDCNTSITNCILWGDIPNEIPFNIINTATITYSCVQNLIIGRSGPSNGNIDEYPLFSDPNNGDYHLKSQSGRWEPASESWIQDEVTSPCIDAGDPNMPVGDELFPNGGRINMGAHGGTREASMSLDTGGLSLPNIAYICLNETEPDQSFKALLESYGCPTTLIKTNEVTATILESCDVVIVANDTYISHAWTEPNAITAIENSGKPIIGLGEGGYRFLGLFDLSIGYPYGGYGSANGIKVIDPNCSLFRTPYYIEIPADRNLELYTESRHIGIYLWPTIPETVTVLGSKTDDPGYFPLVMEHNRFLFWGFTESPEKMTETGEKLFINTVIWTANTGWENEN